MLLCGRVTEDTETLLYLIYAHNLFHFRTCFAELMMSPNCRDKAPDSLQDFWHRSAAELKLFRGVFSLDVS